MTGHKQLTDQNTETEEDAQSDPQFESFRCPRLPQLMILHIIGYAIAEPLNFIPNL